MYVKMPAPFRKPGAMLTSNFWRRNDDLDKPVAKRNGAGMTITIFLQEKEVVLFYGKDATKNIGPCCLFQKAALGCIIVFRFGNGILYSNNFFKNIFQDAFLFVKG